MSSKLQIWIQPYKELSLDGVGVFCKPCGKAISSTRKYLIDQHCGTPLHKRNIDKRNSSNTSQASIRETLSIKKFNDCFKLDLCKAMLASNIPLNKLNNPNFKTFLEKYCEKDIPDESTIRKKYVNMCYTESMSEVKKKIENNFIYFVVDETTDTCGRYVANFLIGVLSQNEGTKPYLIAVKQLDQTNNVTITRFVQESLANIFLPNAIPTEKILLMLSDAAPYMVKSGGNLKVLYPNLIHCTCIAHGINRVAEEVRNQFPLVNKLIKYMKKVFVKAPLRVQLYRQNLPNVPLPPQPVLTRWGTWLEAAIFYFKYLNQIKDVMSNFEDNSAKAIIKAKDVLNNPKLSQQISFINENYKLIIETITKLETQKVLLSTSVQLVENLRFTINAAKGPIANIIKSKFKDVLSKNTGFAFLKRISKILDGEFSEELAIDAEILSSFKYAPVTSVDVERSFSMYKYTLDDRRQSFKMEHIEQHLIVNVNTNTLNS